MCLELYICLQFIKLSMDTGKLENGSYTQREGSPTTPLPSPSTTFAAVLYVENEIFDVSCQKEVRKNKVTSIVVPNGSSTCKSGEEFDYHQRKSLPVELETGDTTCCSKETKKWCCNLTVAVTLLTIIGLFTLPIIFYYVDVPENQGFDINTLARLLNTNCSDMVSFVNVS